MTKKQKLLSLISGGIDSPVASWLMHKRGYDLEFVFFYPEPYMNPINRQTVEKMVRQLKKLINKKSAVFHIIPYGHALKALATECPANLRCILCRRMMFRIASALAKKRNCIALVTGENLAQVASQTLPNMVLEHSSSSTVVLTPLLCNDKIETIRLAEKLGTLSIAKEHTCCGLVPKNPRTMGRESEIREAEQCLDISALVRETLNNVKTETI